MRIGSILAVLVVAGLSAGAYAGVLNGDFSSSTPREDGTLAPNNWSVALTPGSDLTVAKQDIVDGALSLRAHNTYTFDPLSGWAVDQGDVAVVDVYQNTAYAPEGTTGLRFTASAACTGSQYFGGFTDGPRAYIAVAYNDPTEIAAWSVVGDITQTIDLPNLDVSLPVMIRIYVTSELNSAEWPLEPATRDITVTATFDDISFVPEPATMLLLSCGLVGLIRRKRAA